jgi:hypothetical protein
MRYNNSNNKALEKLILELGKLKQNYKCTKNHNIMIMMFMINVQKMLLLNKIKFKPLIIILC